MTFSVKYIAMAATAVALSAAAHAEQITVETGTSKPLRLSRAASSVVIGNQNIADVSVTDPQMIFLTGKSFGTTNLVVLDANSDIIFSGDVVVTTNATNLVTVNRAGSSFTYDCAGECRDAPVIGDDQGHFARSIEQAQQLQRMNEK